VPDDLRTSLSNLIPLTHKKLSSLLNSVCGLYRRQPTECNHRRATLYIREQLLRVGATLRELLGRETHLSVRSSLDSTYPSSTSPIGEIHLFEAHQLATLTVNKLGGTDSKALGFTLYW
jgi:hypothetical protein